MISVSMSHGGLLLTTALLHFLLLRHSASCDSQWTLPSSPSPYKEAAAEEKIRLGSTPPSCHNRCNACNPCKAVQVPTIPGQSSRRPPDQVAYSEYYSNYKPLGWRCSCGARLFNP